MRADLLAGRYRLESLAGRGGMALVFRAWDELLERPVAVKVLAENLAADEAFVSRFRLEARSAARLSHPNIVQVFDACEEDGRYAIVMEYVAGPTLAEELAARGTLPPAEVIEVGLEVCAGLRYAHDAGLVHRDLKPANLLRTPDGSVKIADFGIARLRNGTGLTQTGSVMGTARYLPPEVAAGQDAGPAADVYSLGAALYVLLTGRPPYEAESLAQLVRLQQRAPRPPSALAPAVPAGLDGIVTRCLDRDPARRPAAATLAGSLRHASAAQSTSVEPTEPTALLVPQAGLLPARVRARAVRARRSVGWVGVACLLAAAAAVLSLASTAAPPPHAGDQGAATARAVAPVPPARDPADQARRLAGWIRSHSDARPG